MWATEDEVVDEANKPPPLLLLVKALLWADGGGWCRPVGWEVESVELGGRGEADASPTVGLDESQFTVMLDVGLEGELLLPPAAMELMATGRFAGLVTAAAGGSLPGSGLVSDGCAGSARLLVALAGFPPVVAAAAGGVGDLSGGVAVTRESVLPLSETGGDSLPEDTGPMLLE